MVALVSYGIGAIIGGTLLVALFAWALRKLGGREPREGLTTRLIFAFMLANGIALWGWWGDGAPVTVLALSVIGNGIGALIVRALTLRGAEEQEDLDTFR